MYSIEIINKNFAKYAYRINSCRSQITPSTPQNLKQNSGFKKYNAIPVPGNLIAESLCPEQLQRSKCNQKVDFRRPGQLLFDCMSFPYLSQEHLKFSYTFPDNGLPVDIFRSVDRSKIDATICALTKRKWLRKSLLGSNK